MPLGGSMQVIISVLIGWGVTNAFATIFLIFPILMVNKTESILILLKVFHIILCSWFSWILCFTLAFLIVLLWS